MTDKQEEERYDVIHDFMMNNYTETSTEQHYKDAREFLVYIAKFYDTYNKIRTETLHDMRHIPYSDQRRKIMRDALFTNSDFNTGISNIKQFYVKFLRGEDRDEYSVVRKIIEIYDYNKITYNQIQNIKNLLELYLTGDVETMCNGDKDEIEEFNYLKQLSFAMKNAMKSGNATQK